MHEMPRWELTWCPECSVRASSVVSDSWFSQLRASKHMPSWHYYLINISFVAAQSAGHFCQRTDSRFNAPFPCQNQGQNRTPTPDPRTFTKTSPILLQTPLVSWWHKRGAFENPLSDRDFHPAHLGTSRHKLSMQGCLAMSLKGPGYLNVHFGFGAKRLEQEWLT